ncbi:arylsulfatase [Neolewinella persica]|uniref:arylsulfatase n=1 Tax=Neolewinella persica TaxID=70998 RepID=UPI00035F8E40|nr:arylsulfatase [Neolewinella persica]
MRTNHQPILLRLLTLPALILALTACSSDGTPPESAQGKSEKPNIILIMTDDQGYGDLGAHGNPNINTPHIDALHDESIRFTNFHVATTCAPTRSGLMSGVNCNRAGAWHTVVGRSFLGSRFSTLPELLGDAGYTSGIFGKWHLGDNYPFRPQDRGFDEVLIHGGGGVGQTPDAWNNDYFDDTYFHNGEQVKYEGYCTDVWFDAAKAFIKEKVDKKEPFLAYISTNAPHGPFHVDEKYSAPYRDNQNIPNPNFYGMITNIDDNVGALRESLKIWGADDNTVIIFMTDNGTSAGASFGKGQQVVKGYNAGMRGKKGSEYEGGHRVPFLIRFPDRDGLKPGSYDELTTYTDILPTLLELAGGKPAKEYPLDGTSLMPLLTTGKQEELEDRIVVVDTQRKDLPVKGKNSCVMQGHWRLINGKELYNLKADPSQRENVMAGNEGFASTLQNAYEAWWNSMEEDFKITHRMIIGRELRKTDLLTSHDWHTEKDPPWNQGQIRAGKVDNGWWALEVAKAGQYAIQLFRYPPELALPFSATVPPGEAVPGGEAYAAGVPIIPVFAKMKVGVQEFEDKLGAEDLSVAFNAYLEAGAIDLQTWITDVDGVERGAYYVVVERFE